MLKRLYHQGRMVEAAIENKLATEEYFTDVYVEPWVNGRERGFCFSIHWGRDGVNAFASKTLVNAVFVAEQRNSDDILILPANTTYFPSIPDAAFFRDRQGVPYGKYEEAAERVLQLLGSEYVPVEV